MIKTITHGINLVRHALRDVGVSAKRSSEACGSSKNLNVHHCKPFHLDPALELDPANLITLCMDTKECHLHIGHGGSFKQYNPNVRKDAAEALAHPNKFDALVKEAFANRLVN